MFGMFGNSERRGNFSTREREREREEDMRIGQERKKEMILYIFFVCQLGYERRKRKVERKKSFIFPCLICMEKKKEITIGEKLFEL